jgi:hypothetical protein
MDGCCLEGAPKFLLLLHCLLTRVCLLTCVQVGQQRSQEAFRCERVRSSLAWVEGNAEKLPFPDNHFDLYTIAFGLRNVTNRCVGCWVGPLPCYCNRIGESGLRLSSTLRPSVGVRSSTP